MVLYQLLGSPIHPRLHLHIPVPRDNGYRSIFLLCAPFELTIEPNQEVDFMVGIRFATNHPDKVEFSPSRMGVDGRPGFSLSPCLMGKMSARFISSFTVTAKNLTRKPVTIEKYEPVARMTVHSSTRQSPLRECQHIETKWWVDSHGMLKHTITPFACSSFGII